MKKQRITKMELSTYYMPAADLGKENCNPDFNNVEYIHACHRCTENVTEEEKRYIGKGMIDTILPYTIQDNYNRDRKMKEFPAIILENDFLKAVFLPSLGGRLWSLYDKKMNRELLYVNSVFQPGNLAIRNAWFSGGVEWNFCIKGHNPLTCDPLFVEFAETEKGDPILRMYEYERIRNVVVSIEAYLPANESVLYFRNTIENTSEDETYTYWWSNIAVPQNRETRVIAPAEEAFLCFYNEGSYVLDKTTVPEREGKDLSYPVNSARSQDFFYKISEKRPKWIAAVEGDGKGLLQFSQSWLKGRKTFLWGQGAGGKHWAEFLANPGEAYIEIQAGLAHTQLEHIPMEGKKTISWIEAYCGTDCIPDKVHGSWETAQAEVEKTIKERMFLDDTKEIDVEQLDSILEQKFPKQLINRRIVRNGSGWGYVENCIRKYKKEGSLLSNRVDFPADSVTEKEKEWLALLETEEFMCPCVDCAPNSYMVAPKWLDIARNAAEKSDNWYGWLQLGIMYYANHMQQEARICLEKSLNQEISAWAYRNLAMLAKIEGKTDEAVQLMKKAIGQKCYERGLVINCAQVLTGACRYDDWLKIFDELPQIFKEDGRVLYYKALACVRSGRVKEAAKIITPDYVMCDIKEGEASLSHLWFEIYEQLTGESEYPLPYALDFRMH